MAVVGYINAKVDFPITKNHCHYYYLQVQLQLQIMKSWKPQVKVVRRGYVRVGDTF